jgi:hypothetical protein
LSPTPAPVANIARPLTATRPCRPSCYRRRVRALATFVAAVTSVVALVAAAAPAAAAPALPIPSGSRRDPAAPASGPDRFVSSRGFSAAVDFYRRELTRRGIAHDLVGPSRIRGVDLARFLLRDPRSPYLAVHVYRQDGKTWISFVKRPAPSPSTAPSPP